MKNKTYLLDMINKIINENIFLATKYKNNKHYNKNIESLTEVQKFLIKNF